MIKFTGVIDGLDLPISFAQCCGGHYRDFKKNTWTQPLNVYGSWTKPNKDWFAQNLGISFFGRKPLYTIKQPGCVETSFDLGKDKLYVWEQQEFYDGEGAPSEKVTDTCDSPVTGEDNTTSIRVITIGYSCSNVVNRVPTDLLVFPNSDYLLYVGCSFDEESQISPGTLVDLDAEGITYIYRDGIHNINYPEGRNPRLFWLLVKVPK